MILDRPIGEVVDDSKEKATPDVISSGLFGGFVVVRLAWKISLARDISIVVPTLTRPLAASGESLILEWVTYFEGCSIGVSAFEEYVEDEQM
ncbi:hypothetical protein ACHAXM_009466 [Skeletonema potamos]